MQTKLEKRLRNLNIPSASQSLQDRCSATIPVASATQSAGFQKSGRPVRLKRVVVAGTFLFAALVGVAFLNTRPPSDGKIVSSGSVAFAQMLKAAQSVEFVHAKGRSVSTNVDQKGWHFYDWSRWESWFDAEKGLYMEGSGMKPPSPSLRLSKGTSAVSRRLLLPDGTLYDRSATSTTLQIESNPEDWRRAQRSVAELLVGAGGRLGTNDQQEPKLLSSSASNWKGQVARLLVFEGQLSQQNAVPNAPVFQMYFYINPDTNLVIARQDFAISNGGPPKLVAEYEFDYTRPDSALFDPAPLKVGSDIHVDKTPVP